MVETWMFTAGQSIPVAWQACVESFPPERTDVYFHPAYCATWLEWEKGTAVALYAKLDNVDFLYCFLLKEVPQVLDGHWRYDAQSFYGYGGIITSAEPTDAQRVQFEDAVDMWMQEHGVIAEFVRAHPLIHRWPLHARRATFVQVRTNVYAQLPHALLQLEVGATRRNVAKARRSGIRVERWSAAKGTTVFAHLYAQTAARLGMDGFYHFPERYFSGCAQWLGERAWYLVALANGVPIAALMILEWNRALIYHLGASDARYWDLRPNDLLFATLLEYAEQHGYTLVSFGGGTTNNPEDTLYRYKSKFGTNHVPVFIGKRVHNRTVYDQLCSQWEQRNRDRADRYRGYFLRYRIGEFDLCRVEE